MRQFKFQQKNNYKHLGYISYQFSHPDYKLAIRVSEEKDEVAKILYPITAKYIGPDFDIGPDIVMLSEDDWEFSMPSTIHSSRLDAFKKQLENIPSLLDDLKEILSNIKTEKYN